MELVLYDGELWHAEDLSGDYLAHYGVKGMKWGQRRNNRKIKQLERKRSRKIGQIRRTRNKQLKWYRMSERDALSNDIYRRQLKNKKYDGTITRKERKELRSLNTYRNIGRAGNTYANYKLAATAGALAMAHPKSRQFILKNGGHVATAAYKVGKVAVNKIPNNLDGRVINENGRRVWRAAKEFNGRVRVV